MPMPRSIKAVVYGLGPIGSLVTSLLLERKELEVVGAIEVDPKKVNKDLGEVLSLNKRVGIKVLHDNEAEKFLLDAKPEIVLHSTATYLDKIYPQLVKCVRAGANVISTSETLVYPWYRYASLALSIDSIAKEHDVTVLGAGVNPGFIFDALPAFLTVACAKVEGIRVIRSINASTRRYSFQRKYGLGLSPDEFARRLNRGEITGHVGYAESILLLASIIGARIDKVEEGQEPMIADKPMETRYFKIPPGHVCGVKGFGAGYLNGREFIKLELLAAVDRADYDEVTIEGEPPLKWRSEYGTSGDIATAAIVVNLIPRVLEAPAGLRTIKDIRVPSFSFSHLGEV